MKAKVNYCAEGTWLEPYIGHEFHIYNESRHSITIEYDYGDTDVTLIKLKKIYFDLKLD